MRNRLFILTLATLVFAMGVLVGGQIAPVSAGGGSTSVWPLVFSARQYSGTLYVDEINYSQPTLVLKQEGTFPGSPAFQALGPACPGSSELFALSFGGQPENWSGGYPRYGYSTVFESAVPVTLNIQFGKFWVLADGDVLDESKPADAQVDRPTITTTRGVWRCVSP